MMLTCPRCGAEIPRVNFNPVFGVAICPTYTCENLLQMQPETEKKIAFEKLKAPDDVNVEVEENGKLRVKIALDETDDKWGCLWLVLGVAFLVQLAVPLPDWSDTPALIGTVIARVAFFSILALIAYAILKPSPVSQHELVITSKYVQAHPYNGWLERHLKGVRGIYLRQVVRDQKTTYAVWTIGKKLKNRRELIDNLREDQAVYIAGAIKNYLGI